MYGQINTPIKLVYSWTDYFIEWLLNSSNITFAICTIPFAIFVEKYGLRISIIIGYILLNLSSLLRLLWIDFIGITGYKVLSIIAMIFNGFAATIETFAPPVISMTWFPTHERSTATAIMAASNYLGIAASYIPSFIIPSEGPTNEMESALTTLNIIVAVITFILLIFVIIKFPSKPPTPPSLSSSHSKVDILTGIKALIKNRKIWIISICCACPIGICNMWYGMLGIHLKQFKDIGINQEHSGLIGIISIVAGCVFGIITGIIADKFEKKLKLIISILYVLSFFSFLWFSLIYVNILTPTKVSVYISVIIGGMCIYSTYPLFFEMCMEAAFPLSESSSSGFMILLLAIIQTSILLVPIDEGHTQWMNWVLIASLLIFAVVLIFFKEDYKRLDIDLKNEIIYKDMKNMDNEKTVTTISI